MEGYKLNIDDEDPLCCDNWTLHWAKELTKGPNPSGFSSFGIGGIIEAGFIQGFDDIEENNAIIRDGIAYIDNRSFDEAVKFHRLFQDD